MQSQIGLYNKILYINKNGYLPIVSKFAKVNVFHITLECLISVYMLELFSVLSRFYLVNPTDIPNLLVLILLPSITMIPLAISFGIWCTVHFICKVYSYSTDILNKKKSGKAPGELYEEATKNYRNDVIKVHLFGTLIYLLSTIGVSNLLIHFYSAQFEYPSKFVLHMSIIGLVFGVVWNSTGIFRNQRLVWHNLITTFKIPEIQKKVQANNFRFFICNAIGNIFSISFLCILSTIIIFNIHPQIMNNDDNFKSLLTEYSFFVLSFVALIVFYIKTGFLLLYSPKDESKYVFPDLKTILDD